SAHRVRQKFLAPGMPRPKPQDYEEDWDDQVVLLMILLLLLILFLIVILILLILLPALRWNGCLPEKLARLRPPRCLTCGCLQGDTSLLVRLRLLAPRLARRGGVLPALWLPSVVSLSSGSRS